MKAITMVAPARHAEATMTATTNLAPVNPDPLLDAAQAAEYLSITVPALREHKRQARVAFVKLGRRVLFRRSDLDALIAHSLTPARTRR
jgi:excisionase family DNA binding protein